MTIYIYRNAKPNEPLIDLEHLDNQDLLWLDLYKPTIGEERAAEARLGIDIVTEAENIGREESARFYEENEALYLTINVPARIGAKPYEKPVEPAIYQRANLSLILTKGPLVTVREVVLKALEIGKTRASVHLDDVKNSGQALMVMLEALIERQADLLAKTGLSLDEASLPVLAQKRIIKAEPRINKLGQLGAQLALSRDCLSDLARLIHFLTPIGTQYGVEKKRLMACFEVVRGLQQLCEAQASDLSFLLDGTLGLVGARQSRALNFMAVVTLLFAPPTLIASAFGMNFVHMDIFNHPNGPLIAFSSMVISALLVLGIAKYAKLF